MTQLRVGVDMDLTLTRKQQVVLNGLLAGDFNECLFGGAAGGGKSHLIRVLAIIIAIKVPGAQIMVFRRKVKDLIASHMRGPSSFPILLNEFVEDKLCNINNSNNYISFQNGSLISLNHIQHISDLNNFLSQEAHAILWDEATTFETKMLRFLRSRLRLGGLKVPDDMKKCMPFILYCSNPRGPAHGYLKQHFVDASLPNTPFDAPRNEGSMRRIFIPSLISDNPYMDKDYALRLEGLGDPDVVQAYLNGDWSIVEGCALPMLKRDTHIIKSDICCKSWKIYRAMDWGFSAPTSFLYYTVATGESSTDFNPVKGSIIVHSELYLANDREEGLRLSAEQLAKKSKMHEMLEYQRLVLAGPADSAIWNKDQGPSIADVMSENNIDFVPADKSPGSRVNGLEVLRSMLFNSGNFTNEKPALYMTDKCIKLFTHLSSLQLDERKVEDVDTSCLDHDYDTLRYIVLNKSKEIMHANFLGT